MANSKIAKCIYLLSETNSKESHTMWLTFKSFVFLDFSVGVWMWYIAESVYCFCVAYVWLQESSVCCSPGVAHACSTLKTFFLYNVTAYFFHFAICVFFIFSIQISPSPVILNQCFSFHVIMWHHGNIS